MSWWKNAVLIQRLEGVLKIESVLVREGLCPGYRQLNPTSLSVSLQLLYLIRERDNICKLIHMPAQSGNTDVLKRMRRGFVV